MFEATKSQIGNLFSQYVPKGGLLRATLMLGGVTMATQCVGVLLSPVYSRLYTPADYGVFSVYTSILSIATTVGSLCYETGIPVGKDNREAVGLTGISILIVIFVTFGVTVSVGLRSLLGVEGLGSQLGSYFWLVPVGIVGTGVYRAVRYWALRCKDMGAIGRTSISQLIGSNVIMLSFGIFYPTPMGLMLAGIVGCSAGMWGLARRTDLIPQMRAEHWAGLTRKSLWELAKKYRRLPLVCTPSTLLNSLGLYLPGIMLAPYFGAEFAGQFFMALKIIGIPMSLIGGAISQVFFSGAAAVARERPLELEKFFNRVFLRSAACSVLILLAGMVSPWLVPLALGKQWQQAGEIALWIAIYNIFGLTVSTLSSIPNVVGHLQGQLVIDAGRAVAVFLMLFMGFKAGWTGMAVLKGYVMVMVGNYVACYFLYRHQVKMVARTGVTGWHEPTMFS